MHARRAVKSASSSSGGSWTRWSLLLYTVVAVVIGYNFMYSPFGGNSNTPVHIETAPPGKFTPRPKANNAEIVRPTAHLLMIDDEQGQAPSIKPADETAVPASPTQTPRLAHCFDANSEPGDFGAALCATHLRHLAAIAASTATAETRAALMDCFRGAIQCPAALRKWLAANPAPASASTPNFEVVPAVEALWAATRTQSPERLAKTYAAVTAKYSPVLWHNLLSWSPQITAAGNRPIVEGADPYEDRRAWRHGKREPGTRSKLTTNVIPRPEGRTEEVCEERIPSARFAPFSDTVRVLFEGELALQEAALPTPRTAETPFEPLSSFHTVWAFREPRQCALDKLAKHNHSKHAAISTETVEAFGPNSAWIGYVDNTTGLTESVKALRHIVALGSGADGDARAKSWTDFLWNTLPKKSPALARHLVRAVTTYNPWMALSAFAACAPALSGLGDHPVVVLERPSVGSVMVPAPLAPFSMSAMADCSVDPQSPAADECWSVAIRDSYRDAWKIPPPSADAPKRTPAARRIIGALPRLLCVFTIGVDIRSALSNGGGSTEFIGYHAAAANYARLAVGGCTRTLVIISVIAVPDVFDSAVAFNAKSPRSVGIPPRAADGDALLRMNDIDVLADFPFLDVNEDLHVLLERSTIGVSAEDRAWQIALRTVIQGELTKNMRSQSTLAESFRYADGVPRHGPKQFFDLIAIVPSGAAIVPTNLLRFATRRDVTAMTHAMHVPRLYAHPNAAQPTAASTPAHRFVMMDAGMFLIFQPTLFSLTCPIADSHPVIDFWRCVRRLRLKVTNPTEDGKHLLLPASRGGVTAVSPFAFAVIDEAAVDTVHRWGKRA